MVVGERLLDGGLTWNEEGYIVVTQRTIISKSKLPPADERGMLVRNRVTAVTCDGLQNLTTTQNEFELAKASVRGAISPTALQ